MNQQIGNTLEMFGKLNNHLEKSKNPSAVYFHNLKINIVKILNTIVKHYCFIHPDQRSSIRESLCSH